MSWNNKGPRRNVGESHPLLNKGLIRCIDHTWQGSSEKFAPFSFPLSFLSIHLANRTRVYVRRCIWECTCPAGGMYVYGSPARPHCSVWCKLCMCKKHSIIRPSIIRGCQWALSGWYITLSCPLPQLGPTQPARHAGNTGGQTYCTGRDIGWKRCAVWHAAPMIVMPCCRWRPKKNDECDFES